jgi:hypothetical protein
MKINNVVLSDCTYTRTEGNTKTVWDIPTLLQYVKEKKYKVFDLPIDGIDLTNLMWRISTTLDFIYHYKRCSNTDLKHPVLIDDRGCICDGWHRVVKAIAEDKKYIKAIRIEEMPDASHTEPIN